MPSRVAVVGGGVTGLAAAYELERLSDAEIDLYECAPRLGGKLQTETVGNLLVEGGPDCFFARKPGAMETIRDLGLEGELIEPQAGEFAMLVDGALHRVPRGLVNLAAPDPQAIREANFLSDAAKARALFPTAIVSDRDLSLRAFFATRYGDEFSRLVAEPLLAGTHGGDPDRLSMKALYPAYLASPSPEGEGRVGVLEASRVPTTGIKTGATFLSFRGGMRTLVDALARALARTRLHLGANVLSLDDLRADRTLLAVPANRAAKILPRVGLERIAHRSSAIVTLAFRREDVEHPLDGTGFLAPPTDPFPLTGATWSSAKWAGRAPVGTALLRAFTRGGDERTALDALAPLLGLRAEPLLCRVDRWIDALPQYEVGHLDLVDEIEAGLPEGVLVAGTSYRGVGVPDALRQGRDAARRIAQTL